MKIKTIAGYSYTYYKIKIQKRTRPIEKKKKWPRPIVSKGVGKLELTYTDGRNIKCSNDFGKLFLDS